MKDGFGRTINYLRVSVTDRCNLRCRYCMPEEGVEWLPHEDILSYEDILQMCIRDRCPLRASVLVFRRKSPYTE